MKLQAASSIGTPAGCAGILPQVTTPTAILPELDVVDVRCVALFEKRKQFVH
jgi:hypothetical protein